MKKIILIVAECWPWWTKWLLCKSLLKFYVMFCQLLRLVCFKFSIKIMLSFHYNFFLLPHKLQEGSSNYTIDNYRYYKANIWSSWEEQITWGNIHLFLWRCWYWSGNIERHTHSTGFIYRKLKGSFFEYFICKHNVFNKWHN